MIFIPPALMSLDDRYVSAVGRIRALEKRLMDRQAMLRLLDARNDEELSRVLGDYGYGDAASGGDGIHDFETLLAAELKNTYRVLTNIAVEKRVIRLFARRYDFHNTKTLLKAGALQEKPDTALSHLGEIAPALLRKGVEGESKQLPPELRRAVQSVRDYLESDNDPQGIDLIMDREYTLYSLETAGVLGIPFITNLMRLRTDMNNLKTLLRIRAMGSTRKLLASALLDGGYLDTKRWVRLYDRSSEEITSMVARSHYSTVMEAGGGEWLHRGDIAELERISDDFIHDYLDQARLTASGAEPVVAYLLKKEREIRILRIILVGKLNGLPPESIKQRVRILHG